MTDEVDKEPGNDELLLDTDGVTMKGVMLPVEVEDDEQATEEARLARYAGTGAPLDEPGITYPSTDRPPPADEDHPEFDELPVDPPELLGG